MSSVEFLHPLKYNYAPQFLVEPKRAHLIKEFLEVKKKNLVFLFIIYTNRAVGKKYPTDYKRVFLIPIIPEDCKRT